MAVNPFRFSAPVDIDDLVDRDTETETLAARAREGNNSRLVAPRRYGKTSVLRRLIGELRAEGWQAVYVDFFGVVRLADVTERIERAYAQDLTGPVRQWFEGLRRTLRGTVSVGGGPVPARVDLALDADVTPLLERLALPRRVFERSGSRVLVVFDEFQDVLTAHASLDAVLRSEIQHHGDAASYVFAGSQVGMMSELFSDRHRAFYAQAAPLHLPPLPADATAEFLTARFTMTGKTLAAALRPLLTVAAGHPQRTMLVAHAVWEATPDGGTADEATAATAVARVIADLTDEFREIFSRATALQRQILVALATGTTPYSRNAETGRRRGGSVTQALSALAERGDVIRDDGRWRIVDPLLAEWLRAGRPEHVGAG